MAEEAGESRLYAGIHYHFDKDAGLDIARRVTALALSGDVAVIDPRAEALKAQRATSGPLHIPEGSASPSWRRQPTRRGATGVAR